MLYAYNCFIVLLDFDNFIISFNFNYFNCFDLVMRASSLLAFRCYFELSSINKDFTYLRTYLALFSRLTPIRMHYSVTLHELLIIRLNENLHF